MGETQPSYTGPEAMASFTVAGADPWYGAPVATLEYANGQPVTRPSGLPVDSDGVGFEVELAVDPPYSDGLDVPSRAFQWTFRMPLVHTTPGAFPELADGEYRLRVALPDGQGGTTEVTSAPFTWIR